MLGCPKLEFRAPVGALWGRYNTSVHCTQGSWSEDSGYSGLQATAPLVPAEPYTPVGRYTTHLYTVHKAADQSLPATLGCRQLLLWYQLNLTTLQEGTQHSAHCTQGSWPEDFGSSGLQTTAPLIPAEPYTPVKRYTTHPIARTHELSPKILTIDTYKCGLWGVFCSKI